MTTDRQLLEDAASAYWGDEIDDVCSIEWDEDDQCIAFTHAANQDHNGNDVAWLWNPRSDDGDSRRLQVSLGISLIMSTEGRAHAMSHNAEHHAVEDDVSNGGDANARMAVLRAAAAIGRQMKDSP